MTRCIGQILTITGVQIKRPRRSQLCPQVDHLLIVAAVQLSLVQPLLQKTRSSCIKVNLKVVDMWNMILIVQQSIEQKKWKTIKILMLYLNL